MASAPNGRGLREPGVRSGSRSQLLGGRQAVEGIEGDRRRLVGLPGGEEPDQLVVGRE
jgi:hypothetical protein